MNPKPIISFVGQTGIVALLIALYITFFTAYFSEAKGVEIRINEYNEANVEFILLLVLAPCMLYFLFKK